jgi:hypothetical protein
MHKFEIEVGDTGEVREATEAEVEAIREHLVDYPECKGRKMRDDSDQTLPLAKPRLKCMDCRVKVTVPVRLL